MRDWKERLTDRLELPGELLGDTPKLTLTGSSQVLVENHRELLSYSDGSVEIGCGKTRLRIRGEGLLLRSMNREELMISGQIVSVEVDGA